MWYLKILQTNLIPDWLLRPVLRFTTGLKIRQLARLPQQESEDSRRKLLEKFDQSPIAIVPHLPNIQHYEVPPAFFQLVLGARLKYSCCWWDKPETNLDQAEEAMLDLVCQRAGLRDGMKVLDLGCGWGSLSLWIAEHFPACHITAVSNSRDQIQFITEQALQKGYQNLQARVIDVNHLETSLAESFDRVYSIEMFEHMKNYRQLMKTISGLLSPGGQLFVHHFSHRIFCYEYDAQEKGNWMAQTFFSGGTMPSDDLLLHYQEDLVMLDHWRVGGMHYQRTLRAWLEKMDSREEEVRQVLAATYGRENVTRWWVNWRLFFLACEMTWAHKRGREYLVSHYLFEKR
jgi:cyclopropane-fatty-acyl-phospholipid synthase